MAGWFCLRACQHGCAAQQAPAGGLVGLSSLFCLSALYTMYACRYAAMLVAVNVRGRLSVVCGGRTRLRGL